MNKFINKLVYNYIIMKKINFNLPNELFENFKKHCIDCNNCTMTSKIIELIENELKSNQSSNLSSNQSTSKI